MGYVEKDGRTFLTEDPEWAKDFAPKGSPIKWSWNNNKLTFVGKLLEFGEILTRKRLAELVFHVCNARI